MANCSQIAGILRSIEISKSNKLNYIICMFPTVAVLLIVVGWHRDSPANPSLNTRSASSLLTCNWVVIGWPSCTVVYPLSGMGFRRWVACSYRLRPTQRNLCAASSPLDSTICRISPHLTEQWGMGNSSPLGRIMVGGGGGGM